MTGFSATADPLISCLPISVREIILGREIQIPLPVPPANRAQSDLAGDLFWMLYAGYLPTAEPPQERQISAALLRWLTMDPQWSTEETMWNTPVAAHAAAALWAALLSDPVVRRALDQQKSDGEGENGNDGTPTQTAGAARSLQKWKETSGGQTLRRRAVQAARQTARAIADTLAGWGMEPGMLARVNHQEAMRLLERMKAPLLQEIARLAGRLRGIASQASREQIPRGHVPAEVTTTGEIQNLLPQEIVLLSRQAPPALRAYQAGRLKAGALLGFRFSRTARESGPFFAAVDVSASMMGQRFVTAKAIALGLALLARDEGREFCLAAFSSEHDPLITVSSEEIARNPGALLNWAEAARWGGTCFNRPLLAAMEWVGNRTGADILFISDGEARPSQEVAEKWRAFRKQHGARLLYVPVARGYGDMEKLADRVFPASELLPETGESIAREIGLEWTL